MEITKNKEELYLKNYKWLRNYCKKNGVEYINITDFEFHYTKYYQLFKNNKDVYHYKDICHWIFFRFNNFECINYFNEWIKFLKIEIKNRKCKNYYLYYKYSQKGKK